MYKKKLFFSLIAILTLIFFISNFKNFRIDASSDSLVSQGDEDFKFFSYYQDLFPTKSSLVIAIKGDDKIDRLLLTEIEKISKKRPAFRLVFNPFWRQNFRHSTRWSTNPADHR